MQSEQLNKLVQQYSAALILFARQWCRWPDDAVQEAFVELSNLGTPPRDAVPWLFTVTKRRAMNQSRGEARRQKHYEKYAANRSSWFEDDSGMFSGLDSEMIQIALASLVDEDREVIVARVWGQLSFAQIAELFDCSISSAHRRYERALREMRQLTVEATADSGRVVSRNHEEVKTVPRKLPSEC